MATLLFESDQTTEKRLRDFAHTLSEKDRRRFAAIEATQRGYGGIGTRFLLAATGDARWSCSSTTV